jgi:CBS domain containing-hemolysin-like protein
MDIFERTRVLEALELFREAGTHIGLVIDEYGSIQGVLYGRIGAIP